MSASEYLYGLSEWCLTIYKYIKKKQGRVTTICQDGQIMFSHQRNQELNARVTSRGTVIGENGGHTPTDMNYSATSN
jgi:hypothetical protein